MNTLTVWRLSLAKFSDGMFTGEGGLHAEGRWNPIGARVIYTADSRALAAIEGVVNSHGPRTLHDQSWIIASATFPRDLLEIPQTFPADWRALPAAPSTRVFGARWLAERRSAVLRVPSPAILGEFNFLLNPLHPAFAQVTLGSPEPFCFDTRLAPP